jgi:hypothetical protein
MSAYRIGASLHLVQDELYLSFRDLLDVRMAHHLVEDGLLKVGSWDLSS